MLKRTLVQEGIADNLRFMVIEVTKQIENAQKMLDAPDNKLRESIESRDDYIDNLKSVIENTCFSVIHRQKASDKRTVDLLRATTTVSNNLERIADFAVNVVAQVPYLKDQAFIKRYDFGKFFKEILTGLELVYQSILTQDVSMAFRICRCELTLDMLYKMQFDRILNELRSGRETENLITSHLILRYLERMGDALLNIGEAIIFAAVGEKFKIRQYEALKETMAVSGMEVPISDVEFHSIWGTRSGCRIGRVQSPAPKKAKSDKAHPGGVLFKEGNRKKLLQEKENIERWEMLMPGLPPKVLAHQEEGNQASLLIEFLGGCTLQDVILSAEIEVARNALFLVEQTLYQVWESTKAFAPNSAGFLKQLHARLDDVFRLYPAFRNQAQTIDELHVPSLYEMLMDAAEVENDLPAPYSVFIHGDFNINNIVYDHETQRIHFIDLHRSKQYDPLQDVSVFMISNFRLPVFEPGLRWRLTWAAWRMYCLAREYAFSQNDMCFDARLSLGLVRSFISSTRFELNPRFARVMFQRGVYLLEKLLTHRGRPWEEYAIPRELLEY